MLFYVNKSHHKESINVIFFIEENACNPRLDRNRRELSDND